MTVIVRRAWPHKAISNTIREIASLFAIARNDEIRGASMQSFSRGWAFLKQAWQMAFKDKDLLKPSLYALVVGMIVSVIGMIPIIGVAILLGNTQFGNIILFVLGAIMVFVQFVVTYVFSAMTVYLIYGYLAEGDGRMDKAWSV